MLGYREGLKTSYKKNLTEFLKAANEIKQSYIEKFDTNPSGRTLGLKADTELFSSNSEELVLFPTYTKRHRKVDSAANSSYHSSGLSKNSSSEVQNEPSILAQNSAREDPGIERNEAIVDVDIQGWLNSPHNGRLSRKQKLLLALARQLGGLPAPGVPIDDRALEPNSITLQYENTNINFEEERLSQETEQVFQGIGKKNKNPEKDLEAKKFGFHARGISENIQHFRSIYSNYFEEDSTHLVKKNSLNTADMSQAELAVANSNFMARIGPFLSTPIVSAMISIFFYNDVKSVERTVRTNEAGHFMIRESLDFIPAHIRVLAMENLSATEKVTIIEPKGVSLISDIDDTIKHTLINSGAREVFRNSFVKDLKDLEIDGVREWYNLMYDMGVEFHYVSNSPWQLFPTLSKFFKYVGMPPGSCHLKNYTSVLQGIFEPVSERKKPTITNILSDFPERYFILVGDSGEADLEVYCDVVLANPGRILMVLIRNLNQNFPDATVNSSTDDFHIKEPLVPKDSPLESVFDSEKIFGRQSDISESSLKSCNGQNIDMLTLLGGAHEFTEKQDNLLDITRDTCSNVKNSQVLNNDSKSGIMGKRLPPPRPYKPTALQSKYPTQNSTVTQVVAQKVSHNDNTKSKSPDVPLHNSQYHLRQNRTSKLSTASVRSHDTFKESEDPVKCISLRGNNSDPGESTQNLRLNPLQTSHSSLSLLPFNGDKSKVKESITNRFSWGGLASSFDAENNRSEGNLTNKKNEAWRNRWKRAEQILSSQGVKLREWRVGSDVCLETVQVIEKKLTQINEESDNSRKI